MRVDPQLTEAELEHGPGVLIPPPFLLAGWIGVGLVLRRFFPTPIMPTVAGWWCGGTVIVLGLTSLFWCLRQFRVNDTAVLPYRPDSALILRGLYRFTRNPIYLSLLVIHVGTALACNSGIMVALVVPLALTLHYYVIRKEERYLTRRFGPPYEDYCRQVRRWL